MDEVEVQQRARAFVAEVDTTNIRNDLSSYLKEVNARVLVEDMGKGESGTTFTMPSGKHVITVNAAETEERQRFTICHEIGHIVLGLASSHQTVPSWSYAKRDLNEVMCDTFAAELLMPYRLWNEIVPADEPSEGVITHMATEFRCSFPAAASRYATLAMFPCAFVTMERGTIRYAARSTSLRRVKAWIAPRTPMPDGSVAQTLREQGVSKIDVGEVAQDVWFQDWESGLDLQELARHYQSSDTTISLLWFYDDDEPKLDLDRFGARVIDDGGLPELTGELPWPGKKKRK